MDVHREELQTRNIRLITDHAVALLDLCQVRQVFLNRFRNSQAALQNGGSLASTLMQEADCILFRLSDTGTGIPREQLPHVFALFFTIKPKGTGLGLAICRKIIKDHGSEIAIEGDVGKGTAVLIKLPARGAGEAI